MVPVEADIQGILLATLGLSYDITESFTPSLYSCCKQNLNHPVKSTIYRYWLFRYFGLDKLAH